MFAAVTSPRAGWYDMGVPSTRLGWRVIASSRSSNGAFSSEYPSFLLSRAQHRPFMQWEIEFIVLPMVKNALEVVG